MNFEVISEKDMRNTFNYIVDYIIAKRIGLNGKIEYLVKWEGWHQRDSTWETKDQFASQQVLDIFEIGIQSQFAKNAFHSNEQQIDHEFDHSFDHQFNHSIHDSNHSFQTKQLLNFNTNSNQNNNNKNNSVKSGNNSNNSNNCKTNGKPRKGRPIKAYKFLEDYRRQHIKNGRKQLAVNKEDIEIFNSPLKKSADNSIEKLKTIKTMNNYSKLIGASKRKSRMSCPSAVTISPSKSVINKDTDRSERYKLREKLKINPFNESCLSIESNESHEENKNPQLMSHNMSSHFNDSYNDINAEHLNSNKKRKIKMNNKNNKIAKLDMSCSVESENQMKKCMESPTKVFLNKVRDRYKSKPEVYSQFLNNIIDFKNSKLEINKLLGNHEELINELFNILIINRKSIINRQTNNLSPIKTDEEINQEINKWSQKLDNCLKPEEKKNFWSFLENKSYDSILNASPDYLWLRINELLRNQKDLREEFKKFMPNLCSKPYLISKSQ